MSKHDPHYAPEPPEHPDQWHRHTPDEGVPQDEHAPQANPLILAGIGVVLTVSFVALLIVVVLYYFQYTTKIRREKMETTSPAAGPDGSYAYRDGSLKMLNQGSYAWVDLTHGGLPGEVPLEKEAVQIPLDLAIDKVLTRYGGGR